MGRTASERPRSPGLRRRRRRPPVAGSAAASPPSSAPAHPTCSLPPPPEAAAVAQLIRTHDYFRLMLCQGPVQRKKARSSSSKDINLPSPMTWQVTLQLGDDHDSQCVGGSNVGTCCWAFDSFISFTILEIRRRKSAKKYLEKCSRNLGETFVLGYVLSKSAHSSGLLCGCVSLSLPHPTDMCRAILNRTVPAHIK